MLCAFGEDAVPQWEGMFATAFWDEDRRRLILARDRFGMKPLFYYERDGEFLFASQPRALLEAPIVSAALDPDAAADFLSYGYVPFDRSIFAGIRKLPAAHLLVLEQERSSVRRYWSFDRARAGTDDSSAELRGRLEKSVASHMLSDVPIGAFLSGGLDSGCVTGLLAATSLSPIDTFTIAYRDGGREDLRYAELCAAV